MAMPNEKPMVNIQQIVRKESKPITTKSNRARREEKKAREGRNREKQHNSQKTINKMPMVPTC